MCKLYPHVLELELCLKGMLAWIDNDDHDIDNDDGDSYAMVMMMMLAC